VNVLGYGVEVVDDLFKFLVDSALGFFAQRVQKGEQGFDCILAGRLALKHAMVCVKKMHPARFAAKSESLESNLLARQGNCKNQRTFVFAIPPFGGVVQRTPIRNISR
jgi:hypothetical protein